MRSRSFAMKLPASSFSSSPTPDPSKTSSSSSTTPVTPITPLPKSPLSAAELAAKRQKERITSMLMKIGCVIVFVACGRYYYSAMFEAPERFEEGARTEVEPVAAGDDFIPMPIQLVQARRNPVVFLDISIDGEEAGRIYIRLRGDMAPLTAENFLYMCGNTSSRTLRNTGFHRAILGAFIQGGLLPSSSQPVPEYVVGESFELKPDGPYWVGMAESVSSPDPNHSQFFITTNATPTLEGKHVIFGRVIEGYAVVHAIENRFRIAGEANTSIRITHAAEVDTEARMEFIRGSLSPIVDASSMSNPNFIPKPPGIEEDKSSSSSPALIR